MFTQRQSTSESISQSESGTSNTVRVNDRTEASSSACRLNRVGLLTESRYSTLIFNFVVCFSFTRKQIYLDYPPVPLHPPALMQIDTPIHRVSECIQRAYRAGGDVAERRHLPCQMN